MVQLHVPEAEYGAGQLTGIRRDDSDRKLNAYLPTAVSVRPLDTPPFPGMVLSENGQSRSHRWPFLTGLPARGPTGAASAESEGSGGQMPQDSIRVAAHYRCTVYAYASISHHPKLASDSSEGERARLRAEALDVIGLVS